LRQVVREGLPRQIGYDGDHLDGAIAWIYRAQDADGSGGVPARYDLASGWDDPYPETTGYLIPTLLHYGDFRGGPEALDRAIRMGHWLTGLQSPDGSIMGGTWRPGKQGRPEVFNTGQVLFGFLALAERTGDEQFADAARRAGRWLVEHQEPDGSWVKWSLHGQPHAYYARVAWALARAGAVLDVDQMRQAASRHVDWLATNSRSDGWIDHMSFQPGSAPLTHTIAYTIEGLFELGLVQDDERARHLAQRLLDGVIDAYEAPGSGVRLRWRDHLAATIEPDWTSTSRSACLTGSAQMALCAFRIARFDDVDHPDRLRRFGDLMLDTARSGQALSGVADEAKGGVPGSAPVWGAYGSFRLLNWAAKFLADALLERQPDGLPRLRLG
jgi:hypothetical protein